MPRKKDPRKHANALPMVVSPKSTDEWQEWQDLKGAPETIDDSVDALAADESRRLVSSKLVLGEKDAHEPE